MFIQVIQGQTRDLQGVHRALERWHTELAPGAAGFLGSTSGVTEDGTFITLARFDSEESARTNSDRPEQGAWWDETSALFSGTVSFDEGTKVFTDCPGDPDQAGFVQILRGESSNLDRSFEIASQSAAQLAAHRPEILGRLIVQHGDRRFTMATYFTSEESARAGEQKPTPPEMLPTMHELDGLLSEVTFHDLRDPWLLSPA